MAKFIPLTQGRVALVDEEDYENVAQYKWFFGGNYATTYLPGDTKQTMMHRYLLGAKKGEEVDHINGNRLDYRRANLRFTDRRGNNRNRAKIGRPTSSQFKGVCFSRYHKAWQVNICVDYKRLFVGRFKSEMEAARAYDKAAKRYFGDFARLNFPEGDGTQ